MKVSVSNNSKIEKAIEILRSAGDKMLINDLILSVFSSLGIKDVPVEDNSKLYLDIVLSGEFVYLGDSYIDLKVNHPLEQHDKECSDFYPEIEEDEDDDIVIDDDLELKNEDDDEEEEDYEDLDIDFDLESSDDDYDENPDDKYLKSIDDNDEFDDDDYNEDRYNRYMDEFEDMYDDK